MSLDIDRIQALCFDVDGTLRDTDDHYAARFARLFGVVVSEDKAQTYGRWLVMRLESPANVIYGLSDLLGLDTLMGYLFEKVFSSSKSGGEGKFSTILGVKESLAVLSDHFPMAVVSARPQRGTRAYLEDQELLQFFKLVVSGQTTRRTKPHPQPVIFAAESMGINPANCLMIGDSTVDIRSGRSAGAQTVGVLSGFGDESELVRSGADIILKSVADLPKLLLKK